MPEPTTLHRGIRRIESGTCFTVADGELTTRRYFTPAFTPRPVTKGGEQELYDRIAAALDESVAKHMRADVTVGSFLSSGIDSTAIAALAKRYNPDLLTFTVGFERESTSEVDIAAESAATLGVRHFPVVITAEQFAEAHPRGGLVPRRPGGRPRARAAVLRGPRGPQAREGRALRRGRRRAVRRLHDLPRAAQPGLGRPGARAGRRGDGRGCPRLLPDGMRGKDLLRRASIPLEERYYGNARNFSAAELAQVLRGHDPDLSHVRVTEKLYRQTREAGYDDVPRCSTSTCSPGCAATSWSRPTR